MPRIALLATLLLLLAASAADAYDATYGIDISVDRSLTTERRCPGGVRKTTTIHRVWRASGAGQPSGDGGILQVSRARWRVWRTTGGDEPSAGRRAELEKQWDLFGWEPTITAVGDGRVALDYGRFAPVRAVLRERLPATHRRLEFWHEVGKPSARRLPRDSDGCAGTQTRQTVVGGSIEHLT